MRVSTENFKHALLSSTLACLIAVPAFAQTGSVMSDLADPEALARFRAEAAERIKCDPIEDWDAKMAAFEADGNKKWKQAEMGCALEAGSQALDEMSLPTNLIWAFVTFRVDNIERHLEVLGGHLEYFEVLKEDAGRLDSGAERSAEVYVRWMQNRERAEVILEKIDPIVPKLTEARILRAAYQLASTLRESTSEEQGDALNAAKADLEIAVAEKPEALDGLGQMMLGQILVTLPEFLDGDTPRGIELLENANALNPADMSVHRALIDAYMGVRENDKAVALLQAALEIDPADVNPQDYVDDMQFLGGLAVRLDQPEMVTQFAERRSAMFDKMPELHTRKDVATLGHGSENPFTGVDSNDLN
ncbi:tetratricopeptide repeat protein [Ruegeria sp. 2012CJ41-6]|uniref:Tetratricopeptide repeat protein n=1 Tax=Ruegeria spongiae TaxID=2942209 RepID=A0ABT0Q7H1_9RHOB|nr:tetratricopeptide repeat protein [Ruegeria spongiae]MCL6285824.1 tetratricopeptide repeat protein [Ruegeria spongiae]